MLVVVASVWCLQPMAQAQTAITTISTALATESGGTFLTGSHSSGTGAASASFSSTNNDLQITNFFAGGNQYLYSATSSANATAALVRRNGTSVTASGAVANENGFSVWYANTGTTSTFSLKGAYNTSANNVLLGNNLYVGSDNLFVNNNNQTATPNQEQYRAH